MVQKDQTLSNLELQRDFAVSLVMSPQRAVSMGNWLSNLGEKIVKGEKVVLTSGSPQK